MRTVRPVSSTTRGKQEVLEGVSRFARERVRLRTKKRRRQQKQRDEALAQATFSRSSLRFRREILPKEKSPARRPRGFRPRPFSRRARGLCAKEGWPGLRLLEPITVAGPRPIRTAFPASPAAT